MKNSSEIQELIKTTGPLIRLEVCLKTHFEADQLKSIMRVDGLKPSLLLWKQIGLKKSQAATRIAFCLFVNSLMTVIHFFVSSLGMVSTEYYQLDTIQLESNSMKRSSFPARMYASLEMVFENFEQSKSHMCLLFSRLDLKNIKYHFNFMTSHQVLC